MTDEQHNGTHATELTFGSLFAGIGGIDLGFERAGLRCKWQVEIDEYARRVLAKHWPNVRRWDDVRTWPQPDTEYVDIIAGGFPCQDISYAGKGAGLAGERSGLFYEAMRIVRKLEPRFVVLENVAALLTRGMGDVLGTLASLGYDVEWDCIPAAAVGAPHIRDRVFIVCYNTNGQKFDPIGSFPQWTNTEPSGVSSVLSDSNGRRCEKQSECDCESTARQQAQQRDNSLRLCDTLSDSDGNRWEQVEQLEQRRSSQTRTINTVEQRTRRIRKSNWWTTEPAVGRVANGVSHRVDRLRGLGNAVVPQVAEFIARRLLDSRETGCFASA